MTERWGALPLGEEFYNPSRIGSYHAEERCALCGVKGRLAEFHDHPEALKRTVLAMTQAVAHVCVDTVACERRRYKAKNP